MMSASDTAILPIPDFQAISKFPVLLNPMYATVRKESSEWMVASGFWADEPLRRAFFHDCNFELLCCRVWSSAPYNRIRTLCDWINATFVYDETTDGQGPDEVQTSRDDFMRALKGESCGGSIMSKLAFDVGERLRADYGPVAFRRFLQHTDEWTTEVIAEADFRERSRILSLEEYMAHRRNTAGVRDNLDLLEYAYGFELPEIVVQDAQYERMLSAIVDLVALANDGHSYSIEYAKGQITSNVLTIIMHEKQCSLQQAAEELNVQFASTVEQYLVARDALLSRSYGRDHDTNLRTYMRGLEDWVSGTIKWGFESKRYFGDKNAEVEAEMTVPLRVRASS